MKNPFKLIAVLSLAVFVSASAFATTNTNAKLEKMSAQIASLQSEVKQLRKQHHNGNGNKNSHSRHHRYQPSQDDTGTVTTSAPPISSQTISSKTLRDLISEEQEYLPFDLDVPGQAFVSTGPYVGVPLQFAGNNLVVNSPSVNTDVILLGIRKKIMQQLSLMHGEIAKEPYHSHLLLSGTVEGRADYFNKGGSPSRTDINVTNVSLDAFFIGPSDWTLGFIEFSYDEDKPSQTIFTTTNQYRVANSRVFINKAFITIGDFAVTLLAALDNIMCHSVLILLP